MPDALSSWLAAAPVHPRAQGAAMLTTVGRAWAWLAPDQGTLVTQNEDMIRRLIQAVSGLVLNNLNRDTLARVDRVERYPSSRTGRLLLRHWPALTLTSVMRGAETSPAQGIVIEASGGGYCYLVASAMAGSHLIGGPDGLVVSYTSGFVRSQDATVPSAAPYVVESDTVLLQDEGVSGVDYPYTVDADGSYTFDARDAGKSVTLFYSHVPPDIEQVVIEEVGLAMRTRQRIGEASKALPNGGGTSSYLPRALSELSLAALNNYRLVVPT